jgi:hypothetical protein
MDGQENITPAPDAAPEAAEPAPAPAEDLGDLSDPALELDPVEPTEPAEPVEDLTPEVPADPYEEFGGRESVEAAVRLHQAAQTDAGLVDIFLQAGRNLGFGLDQMRSLFGEVAPEEAPEEDLDEPLTRGQFLEEQRKQQEAAQQAQAQAQETANRNALHEVVTELGISEEDRQVVLGMADNHLKDPTPEGIKAAVRQGYADFQAKIERQAKEYLRSKRAQAAQVPSAPAGAAGSETNNLPEPKNTSEAIKIARQRLGIGRR